MGKHKEKSKKHKREKNHKDKKHKRRKSSSSEEEWVEKKNDTSSEDETSHKSDAKKLNVGASNPESEVVPDNTSVSSSKPREDWMSLPASFLTDSNLDRRRQREADKRLEREKEQYNPSECPRELNPYWKDGGDGLPKFKKPSEEDDHDKYKRGYRKPSSSSWRKREPESSGTKRSSEDKRHHDDRSSSSSSWKRSGSESSETRKSLDSKHQGDRSSSSSSWKKREPESSDTRKSSESKRRYEDKNSALKSEEPSRKEFCNSELSPDTKNEEIEHETLSDKELNVLASKLVKAEIMGNTQLANQLKEKLETARKQRGQSSSKTEEVVLTQTDSRGQVRPVRLQSEYAEPSGNKKKKQKVETHSDGQRVRYFADDDKYSLKQMFENEKFSSVEDQNLEFIKMAGKIRKNDDMDEIFADNIRKKESDSKVDARNKDKAISEHNKVSQSLDNCRRCLQSDVMLKHLMISMNETVYLSLPSHEPITDGHCLIVPIRHVPCATQLDENEWTDLMDFRKALTRMFSSKGNDVIFFESAMELHRFPHMYVECIPLPKEEGDLAPIYFKKAIDESESEWAQNKKLISMKGKDVRRAVPKGLPYFCVSFGMDEGFAHVIEDEKSFPSNFAQEIVGGMLDLHHSKWRKPKQEKFDEQSKRVLEFNKEWKNFDCTNT